MVNRAVATKIEHETGSSQLLSYLSLYYTGHITTPHQRISNAGEIFYERVTGVSPFFGSCIYFFIRPYNNN